MKKRNRKIRSAMAAALAVSMVAAPCSSALAASTSDEITQREIDNAALAREAAGQGMVLLENENHTLPLKTKKLALFGSGAVRTIKGGFGSGDPFNGGLSGGGSWDVDLNERYNIHIYNTFKKAGYDIVNSDMLDAYADAYDAQHKIEGNSTMNCFKFPEMEISDEELADASADSDTAIYVISRNAGEGTDRTLKGTKGTYNGESYDIGDYYLTDLERENLERVAASFKKTIVVLNVGGIMDTKFYNEINGLDAMLLMGQAGQEGGNALLDVLTGAVTPSGKLADTWAENYSDYPASDTFANADRNVKKEVYNEGIYVGYRYFDTFNIKPKYEFGYGLSYTDFKIETQSVTADADKVTVKVKVTNTGSTYSGKEIVQVYYSAPDSAEAEKEYQELGGFAKTDELAPGESQILTISYDTKDMAYYNEDQAAYILDKGKYYVRVGDSSRNTSVEATIEVDDTTLTEQLSNQMEVPDGEDLVEWSKPEEGYSYPTEEAEKEAAPVIKVDASEIKTEDHASAYENEEVTTYTTDAAYEATQPYEKVEVVEKKDSTLKDVIEGKATMGEFVAQMSVEELAALNCGSGWGVANENSPIVGSNSSTVKGAAGETTVYDQYGIPGIVLADGPGGVRVAQKFDATIEGSDQKQTLYQYCTAWPVSYVQAQTWDTDLVKRIGVAFGKEVDEMNITLLLGPSQNIHRDPLCGRNFEYYSEDPVVSGVMAAACTLGVQETPGVGACLKHFAANNQESNRNAVDTIVSERTLREIYLKGFEIAVKESRPMSIMTSYNLINGVPTADSYDLCTNIARGEWGFDGLIMTDWNGGSSTPMKSMHAGNDMIMPGGAERAQNIVSGMQDAEPNFDERGQVAVDVQLMYGFVKVYSAKWNEFTPSAEGTKTVSTNLGEGYTATVADDGRILVNGEEIYLNYRQGWFNPGTFSVPATTDVVTVSNDGKTLTYKGEYVDNNIICLGDVQKSAINNLNIIMNSNMMQRRYGVEVKTSYNLINGVPTADSYDLCTNIARGEWGFDGLIMTDWNGGSSTPMKSMHAGNDMIMPGGAERAQNIVSGMQDAEPNFDERGQVAVDVQLMYGFVKVYSAKWNEFTPSAEGTKTVSTNLGEGYTATVADDGRILVNGEEIYLNYRQGWFNPGTFSVPATTDVVTVSNDGKTLTYKGEYVDNNIICLGDVQKSAINNLNIIMNSNMMQRRYGVEVKDYSTALGNLKAYQTVTKDSVQKASANVESLNKVIAMVEELNASDYTKASWAAVEEALNAAKAVAAKADATVIETTNAMTDLLAAMNSLEQGVEKTHLEISIKEAEKVLVRADKYSSLGNLEEAVANGKAVLANEDADQETVDAAATAILNELSKAVKNADLSSLESLIKSAKKLQDGNYTSNSLAKLDEVIKAAEAVVANKNRTVEEVNKAYSDLIDAVISLEKKGNKAALKAMLEKAAAVLEDSDAYVAATIEGLADVKADAQAVYDNDDAVQNEVNAAVRTLTLKLAEARLLGDVDNDGAVTTADSTALLAASAELTELDADAAAAADVNGDGVADTGDAALILEYAAEKVAGF